MGIWNHRVVRRIVRDFGEDVERLGIHEVFYDVEGETLWTDDPVSVEGESIDELRQTLGRMLRALDHPILDDNEKEPTEQERP